MERLQMALLSAAIVLVGMAPAQTQESQAAPSPFFDCPYVNFFDKDCPQLRELWKEQQQRRLLQEGGPSAGDHGEDRQAEQPEHDDNAQDPTAEETYILFPKDSLAPDAPRLFRLLLAEPTLDNARRYVRWYARRTARLQAVQALIKLAGSELEAEVVVGEEGQR